MTTMLDPAPANPNHFASTSEAHAVVCLDPEKLHSLQGRSCAFPRSQLPTPGLASSSEHSTGSHFQALFLYRAFKFHTLKIVRGI